MKRKYKETIDYRKLFFVVCGGILIVALVWFLFSMLRPVSASLSMVSGTEYISGEEGQVIARIADRNGRPISGALCNATILFPEKSFFMLEREMSQAQTSGNYFVTFTVPAITGIYEYNVDCLVGDDLITTSRSFHVSPAYNIIAEIAIANEQRHQETLSRIQNLRQEILAELNETISEDILEYLDQQTITLVSEMQSNTNQSISSINDNFQEYRDDMLRIGLAITEIFE